MQWISDERTTLISLGVVSSICCVGVGVGSSLVIGVTSVLLSDGVEFSFVVVLGDSLVGVLSDVVHPQTVAKHTIINSIATLNLKSFFITLPLYLLSFLYLMIPITDDTIEIPSLAIPPIEKTNTLYTIQSVEVKRILFLRS